jgi:ABC-type multidrug transport system ATPase subunit
MREVNFRQVNVIFGERRVLSNFTHTFSSKYLNLLLGTNGCGKSTLLKVIAGELFYQGVVELSDSDRRIGFYHHLSGFYDDLTLLENLSFYGEILNVTKDFILKRLAFWQLESFTHTQVRNLSSGVLSRGALLRTLDLISNPNLILLDEPSVFLDEVGKECCVSRIQELVANEVVVIVATHEPELFSEINLPISQCLLS